MWAGSISIHLGTEKFEIYIISGSMFLMETDHLVLIPSLKKNNIHGILARWIEALKKIHLRWIRDPEAQPSSRSSIHSCRRCVESWWRWRRTSLHSVGEVSMRWVARSRRPYWSLGDTSLVTQLQRSIKNEEILERFCETFCRMGW